MATPVPMQGDRSIEDHITVGLGKVAAALRQQAWEGGDGLRRGRVAGTQGAGAA